MLKKGFVTFIVFLLLLSFVPIDTVISSEPASAPSSAASFESYPQDYPKIRTSNYTIENRSVAPYPQIITSDQQASPSNTSLLEKTLSLNLTVPSIEVTFDLTTYDFFLAIDGASQSFVLRVDFTIYYPNGTLATESPITTTATSPMHFYIASPSQGTWRVIASLIDTGDTTAWIQAISYNRGTKHVSELEKQQIHLLAGQNIYFKIPLSTSMDWFYLYVNKFAGADVEIVLYEPSSYYLFYGYYWDFVSEFFPSTIHSSGVYLLKIVNYGSTDVFVEIMRPSGVKFTLNIDQGNTIECRMRYDLEFFYFTVNQSYDWIALDGAVVDEGMSAEYILINPNLDVIFEDYSWGTSAFIQRFLAYPMFGAYVVAIFGNEYAIATIKVTSASSLDSVGSVKLDQNWTFAQSGQAFYLRILQSQRYFMFAGTTSSDASVLFTLFAPDLSSLWIWGPSTGLAFYPPTKPIVSFYILKIQGQTNSSTLFHVRFQGDEDHTIETPDCSYYIANFLGDIITANLSVRNSNFLFQLHCQYVDLVTVGLYDVDHNEMYFGTFDGLGNTGWHYWRKGYEHDLPPGNWLQVVIFNYMSADVNRVEIITLQSGDESKSITTPFQHFETFDKEYAFEIGGWQVRSYKVQVVSSNWFGIVSQLLSVNMSAQYHHPSLMFWVFDSTLAVMGAQGVDHGAPFSTDFWANPILGTWLVVVAGFEWNAWDKLNCSISFIGDSDFCRDWPIGLIGTTTSFPATEGNETFTITILSNSTISNFVFKEWNREIKFNASGPEGTEGFSVVTIPKQLADRPFTVFIDGEPQMGVLSIQNDTHTSIYFSYDPAANEVEIITEFPSWLAPQLFMLMVLIVAILAKKKPHANPKS